MADLGLITFALTTFAFVVFVAAVFFAAFTTSFDFVLSEVGFVVDFLTTFGFALTALLAALATFSLFVVVVVVFFTVLATFFGGILSSVAECFVDFASPGLSFRMAFNVSLFTRKRPLSVIPAIE